MEQDQIPQAQPTQEASAFERLAKQERFQTETRQKLDSERKAFESDRQEFESYKSVKANKESDPFKILEHFGLDLDFLNKKASERNSPIDPTAAKALAAVEQMKSELEAEKASVAKEKLTQQEAWLQSEITKAVKEGGYDVIENLGLERSVREYMEEVFEVTGKAPSFQEACESVTEYVAERAKKIVGSKWLQPKETIKPKESIPSSLSNRMSQSSSKISEPMTESERMKEAMRLLRSQ